MHLQNGKMKVGRAEGSHITAKRDPPAMRGGWSSALACPAKRDAALRQRAGK